jgi:hypothetical protein
VIRNEGLHVPRGPDVAGRRRPVRQRQRGRLDLVVRHRRQQVRDHIDPRAPLVVGLDHVPWGLRDIGHREHVVLGAGVVLPAGERRQVHRGQLPLPQGVVEPGLEPALLLFVADREPVLAQQDPVFHQQPLEDRALVQEPGVLLLRTEPHHVLHAGPVVPGPVEQRDLAGGRQALHVPLEVPLGAFPLGRRGQRRDPREAGVEVLDDALDRAALAGRVAAFEDHDDPRARGARPLLELHELHLQPVELLLVDGPGHPVTAGLFRHLWAPPSRHTSCSDYKLRPWMTI